MRRLALWLAVAFLGSGVAFARGGKEAVKAPEWTEEEGRTVLRVFEPAPLKAYFSAPSEAVPEGKKAELVVVLHGHGGTATGMLGYAGQASAPRQAFVLACEGSVTLQTDRGEGHSWNDRDVAGVLACLDAVLAKHPVDPKRVVLMGHSMGGTWSLKTYAARPAAFAGVYTTAAPATPSGAQKGARVAVSLGTQDGNYAGFPAAVAAAEKTVVGRIMSVQGLGHDTPPVLYSQEAIAWILDSKAPSEVLYLPGDPSAEAFPPPETPAQKGKGHAYRHALVFQAGGRGAPEGALARAAAKAKAQTLAAAWKKAPPEGRGDLAAQDSEDPVSKEQKGAITGAVLARYGGPLVAGLAKLKGGDVAGPFEGDAGWHVVARDP